MVHRCPHVSFQSLEFRVGGRWSVGRGDHSHTHRSPHDYGVATVWTHPSIVHGIVLRDWGWPRSSHTVPQTRIFRRWQKDSILFLSSSKDFFPVWLVVHSQVQWRPPRVLSPRGSSDDLWWEGPVDSVTLTVVLHSQWTSNGLGEGASLPSLTSLCMTSGHLDCLSCTRLFLILFRVWRLTDKECRVTDPHEVSVPWCGTIVCLGCGIIGSPNYVLFPSPTL